MGTWLTVWGVCLLLSGCFLIQDEALKEQSSSGNAPADTQWGRRGEGGACARFAAGDASKPTYLRVVRAESFVGRPGVVGSEQDPPKKIWRLFQKHRPSGELVSFGLARLDLLLVWGDPLGREGCVLDALQVVSGVPKYGASCVAELKRLQAKADNGQLLDAFDQTVAGLCGQQAELESQDPGRFKIGRVILQHDARFLSFGQGTPGSEAPIPEGVYSIGREDWLQGWENWLGRLDPIAIGPVMWNLDPISYSSGPGESAAPVMRGRRGLFRLHFDVNQAVIPGTAGCVGVDPGDAGKLLCWMRRIKPEIMVVDYGRGTVNGPPGSSDTTWLDSSRIAQGNDGHFTGRPDSYACAKPSQHFASPSCNWWQIVPPCRGNSPGCLAAIEQWEKERCRP